MKALDVASNDIFAGDGYYRCGGVVLFFLELLVIDIHMIYLCFFLFFSFFLSLLILKNFPSFIITNY